MADPALSVTHTAELRFDSARVEAFLQTLEIMAGGHLDARLAITPRHDALDAIAHGINVLVGELNWASARAKDAQAEKEAVLRAAVAAAETRSSAMLKALPDLMFVLRPDGTYVDYHVPDPSLLFVAPGDFLGRTVREVLPAPLADTMMDALERACASEEPITIEYELPMDEPRFYEARIVQAGADRLLSIVRDITDARRASELSRDLAQRLIARQEIERQRIARELHDDICQRLALLNNEIDLIAAHADATPARQRLHRLSAETREIGAAVHDLAYDLHPSRLHILGLVGALRALCADTSLASGLQIAFTHGEVPPVIDANVSLCLYRIVQEALRNVVRHSHARDAQVSLTRDERHIALQIADSGIAFDRRQVAPTALGLVSMQERVAALKGRFAIDAVTDRGTRIDVRIPLLSQTADSTPA
jgi:signal transduction histidine kinase